MQDLHQIRLDRQGPVAIVTLHRPERLNAYTVRMGVELFGTLRDLDRDDGVRCIVVTGEGKGFCAGADLAEGGGTFAQEGKWKMTRELEEAILPWNMGTPVIGAINGAAVGIGATLPLLFDVRVASERAKVGFVFVRRGIIPELHSHWLLPRLVGASRALELFITGRLLSAQQALEYGLVSRVVPHDDLLPAAMELAGEIATQTAPASVALTKRLVWRHLMQADPIAAKAEEDGWFDWCGRQPDAAEGVQAFLDKRAPQWTGSTRPPDEVPER
jgi:enoyl-CoA hydratase/carnithine racemase